MFSFFRLFGPFCLVVFLFLASCAEASLHGIAPHEQSHITVSNINKFAPQSTESAFGAAQKTSFTMTSPAYSSRQSPQPPLVIKRAPVVRRTKVALLVPLTGKGAALGQAMVNAAQLAVFDISAQGFDLMPRDTGVNAVQAMRATKEAIASGAQFIIGPLFASDVAAVRPVVHKASLNMLALSTDVSLAEEGAYVMGFAPAPQVERVVSYAAAQGLHKFAALVPANAYGRLVTKAFERVVKEQGAELVAIEKVDNLAFLATKKESIEALFLPFGGQDLRRIAQQLEKAGFDKEKIKLLGTGLWDEDYLTEGLPFLIGGWFATAETQARGRFINAYQETYGEIPPRLATLAYDATALAAVLAKSGRGFDRDSLSNKTGFAGLDGVFRLKAKGQVERALAVSENTSFGNKIIDPAPTSFTNP